MCAAHPGVVLYEDGHGWIGNFAERRREEERDSTVGWRDLERIGAKSSTLPS